MQTIWGKSLILLLLGGLPFSGYGGDNMPGNGLTSSPKQLPAATESKPNLVCTAQYLDNKDLIKDLVRASPDQFLNLTDSNKVDTSCLVSATSAQRLLRRRDFILIDSRKSDKYAELHIPGSMNMPSYAIKTKAHLKSKGIILLNDGLGHIDLLATCQQLKTAGFKHAKVLAGGLRSWVSAGGQVQGSKLALERLRYLEADDVFIDRSLEHMVIFDLGEQVNSYPGYPKEQIMHATNIKDLKKNILSLQANASGRGGYFIPVVATEDGENYLSLARDLGELESNVRFLQGGTQGFKKYIDEQLSILSWKEVRKHIKRRCGT